MNRQYYNRSNTIVTKLSGGREHFGRRPKYEMRGVTDYNLTIGETLYELASRYIGEEKNWDVLLDCNVPLNPLDLFKLNNIKLPTTVIEVYRDIRVL